MANKRTKRMGRPPKDPADKQGEIISVRMTRADRKRLEHDAEKAGMSLSAFLIHCWKEKG